MQRANSFGDRLRAAAEDNRALEKIECAFSATSDAMALAARTASIKLHATMESVAEKRAPSVYVFNPFSEGYIAEGSGFTPVKHQAMLARDLANLPQFLCEPGDIVLIDKRPAPGFLKGLEEAGFALPEFVEFTGSFFDLRSMTWSRKIGSLRPWAWGPDSVALFERLFGRGSGATPHTSSYFNREIARLYSKAWSADFLRKVLAHCHATRLAAHPWLCTEQQAGMVVNTMEEALEVVAVIRRNGHHRVVIKEALGLAGHNAIRLWEPAILPAQRQWLSQVLRNGRQVVVEPWLDRELDFSVQLEMGPRKLELCGYTGLVNDLRGQYLANWAEADYHHNPPAKVTKLLGSAPNLRDLLQRLFDDIFSLLQTTLHRVGFVGPVSIDAFVYRTPEGDCRLKPVVEINPRYTMGRLTVELMKHACPGTCGFFRLVSRAQAGDKGFADFSAYARSLGERLPVRIEGEPTRIRHGALCLNDPGQAQACLAIFEVRNQSTRDDAGEMAVQSPD